MIETLGDVVLKLCMFKDLQNIKDLVYEEDKDVDILDSTNLLKLESDLYDDLSELELALSSFLFNDEGIIDEQTKSLLSKKGFKIIKLSESSSHYPHFTHKINCDAYSMLFSC